MCPRRAFLLIGDLEERGVEGHYAWSDGRREVFRDEMDNEAIKVDAGPMSMILDQL